MALLFGIDLGGTKTEGIVLDTQQSYKVVSRIRIPTEREQGYQHILHRIGYLLVELTKECGRSPISLGIGTPGILDPHSQTIKNSNTTCLIGQPLKQDLSSRFDIPVQLANDANCFALAETKLGIVQDLELEAATVVGLIMGTGIGGGITINGHLMEGAHGMAGEWGHNFLDKSGGECYCGKKGCVETILSGPALETFYSRQTKQKRSLAEIASRHYAGKDVHATAVMFRLLQYFGKAMAPVVNVLDPDVIVIGGGVGNIELLYSMGPGELAKHTFNSDLKTKIVKPKLGDSAGVLGAALLVDS